MEIRTKWGRRNEKIKEKRNGKWSKSKATDDDDDWKIKLKQISIVQLRSSEAIQIKGIIVACHSHIALSFNGPFHVSICLCAQAFNLHFFKHYLDEWNCRLSFMQPGVSIKMTQQNICPDEWQNARIPTVTQFQALQFNSTTKYRKTNRECSVWMRVMSSWKHIRLSDIMVSFSLSLPLWPYSWNHSASTHSIVRNTTAQTHLKHRCADFKKWWSNQQQR